jgi:hypothetical protein
MLFVMGCAALQDGTQVPRPDDEHPVNCPARTVRAQSPAYAFAEGFRGGTVTTWIPCWTAPRRACRRTAWPGLGSGTGTGRHAPAGPSAGSGLAGWSRCQPVRGHSESMDVPGAHLDHEEHVHPARGDRRSRRGGRRTRAGPAPGYAGTAARSRGCAAARAVSAAVWNGPFTVSPALSRIQPRCSPRAIPGRGHWHIRGIKRSMTTDIRAASWRSAHMMRPFMRSHA